jgi:hypothetical protein
MRRFILGAVVWVLAGTGTARAQVPPVVGFDGVLFTSEQCCGYSYEGPVTFRLCDSPDGECKFGGSTWEETHDPATVDGGYLHADLGTGTPLPAGAFEGARWLEVELGGGIGVLAPRVRLASAPYALQCANAAMLGNKAAEAFAAASHGHAWSSVTGVPAALADGAVSWDEVTGKPGTFEPTGHVHAIAEVTGLQGALDGKSPASHKHDGTYAAASHGHDDQYYREAEVDTKMAAKADAGASYTTQQSDARYYQKSEADAKFALKALETTVAQLQATVNSQATLIGQLQTKDTAQDAALTACQADLAKHQACPADMVRVGDFCVDRYEPSLWAKKVDDGKGIDCAALDAAVAAGWNDTDIYLGYAGTRVECGATTPPAMCLYRQYGSPPGCNSDDTCDDYPAASPDSGNWTKPLYACAIKGVLPSRSMTWFQAQQACGNAGKHLITNGEWQQAVAGTPDTTACNTATSGAWKTGKGTCKSAAGVEDMIGNLWEWADLWGQAGPVNGSYSAGASVAVWPASYGDGGDKTWNVNGQAYGLKPDATRGYLTGLPFAAIRGGDWGTGPGAGAFAFGAYVGPSSWYWPIGLRCARGG